MNLKTYQELYETLATRDDLERLQDTLQYDDELLMVIYTQRVVRDATKRFYKVKRHARRFYREWQNGTTLAEMAIQEQFPPILLALMVLEQKGISRRQFWKLLADLEAVDDPRLRRELQEVGEQDLVYSPEGTERQYERGAWGEEKLAQWLTERGVPFQNEEELRANFDKTPDALLGEPVEYNGGKIHWIESKATFGDPVEIRRHVKRQLRPYLDLFGEGLVIYWFGYAEDAELKLPKGVAISDGRDFGGPGAWRLPQA